MISFHNVLLARHLIVPVAAFLSDAA